MVMAPTAMKCEVNNCKNEARYFIYRIHKNLSKDWLKVCTKHEEIIGNSNLKRQGYNSRGLLR